MELGAPGRLEFLAAGRLELGAPGKLEFLAAGRLELWAPGRLVSREVNRLGSEAVGTSVFNEGEKGAAIILQVQLLLCFVRIEDLHQHHFGMDF